MNNINYLVGKELFFSKTLKTSRFCLFLYFKVKRRSYIGQILYRLWEYFVKNNILLYSEYKKYYIREYKNYAEYLERHYTLPSDLVKKILNNKLRYKCLKDWPDVGIQNLVQTPDAEIIRKFLEFLKIVSLENYDED